MKKIRKGVLTSLLLLLITSGVMAQTADVPPGHWAYDAVQTLIQRGYLTAGADGLFRGDEPVSRFDLASVVARMLDDIEAGRVQIGTAADVEMLRRLEGEFRAELVQWYEARRQLEESHGRTQRQIAVIDEQLNNVLFELELIDAQLAAAGARLDGHDGDVASLTARLGELGQELASANARLQTEIDALYTAVVDALAEHGVSVDEQFEQQMSAYGELAAELEALQARVVDELVPLHNRLSEQGAAMFMRLNELDEAFAAKTDELRADVDAHEAAIEQQQQTLQALLELLSQFEQQAAADTDRFDDDIAELRAMVSLLDARLTELEEHNAELTEAVWSVVAMGDGLRSAILIVQDELEALYRVLGTSEEQIASLTERVRRDLDEQLALTLAREGQLSRQLSELQAEFDSYKARSEQELQGARSMSNIGIGAALLALVLTLTR